MNDYSIDRVIAGPFEEAVAKVKVALKEQGFGTLTEIDVRATLREKIGKEIEPYTILGVCNPNLAARAIEIEPNIGVFLPCTVVLRQDGDIVRITAQDPALMESLIGTDGLAEIARDAREGIVAGLEAATVPR